MSPTPRELARERTEAEILRLACDQLATAGPAELSLRAIARELGIVSSAIYRYVRNRDELLTLLVIDSYNELGDAVDQATSAVADEDYLGRFLTLGRAVRTWALAEPARYALLYGTPVPGYDAPGDRTTAPGTRVAFALAKIADEAWRAGRLRESGQVASGAASTLAEDFARIRDELELALPPDYVQPTLFVWSSLFGAVTFEVFGQYGTDTLSDPSALFEAHLHQLAGVLGLTD